MTTDGSKWTVGVTDERANIVETFVNMFGSEEEACEECIKKLRLLNQVSKFLFSVRPQSSLVVCLHKRTLQLYVTNL